MDHYGIIYIHSNVFVIVLHEYFTLHRRNLDRCLVHHEVRAIYCPVPKAACTSWRIALITLTDAFKQKYPGIMANDIGNIYARSPNE